MRTIRSIARRWTPTKIDISNLLRFGSHAPRNSELIWIDPSELIHRCVGGSGGASPQWSGRVVGGSWDLQVEDILSTNMKVKCALDHWGNGVPWEETGIFEYNMQLIADNGGQHDGLTSLAEIVDRYAYLDRVFLQIAKESRFRTQKELSQQSFRERGGIGIHIGRNNQPLWGADGSHRIGMAFALGLRTIPARLLAVHRSALVHWREKYRTHSGSTPR